MQKGERLGEKVIEIIIGKLDRDYDATVTELKSEVRRLGGDTHHLDCRAILNKLYRQREKARFQDYWRNYFECLAGVRQVRTPIVTEAQLEPRLEPTRSQSLLSEETGIIRVVDGFQFRLPSLTLEGAIAATVSLSHLAERLGYSDKCQLKDLAKRHASNLAEFGETLTARVSWPMPNGGLKWVDEPMYNEGQAGYLMTESGTAEASRQKVKFIKAAIELRRQIASGQVVAAQSPSALDYRELASVVGMAVAAAMTPIVAQLRPRQRAPRSRIVDARQNIPQTAPSPDNQGVPTPVAEARTNECRRVAEQDQATERKVLSAMIKRYAGACREMGSAQYGARMSVAYGEISDKLLKYGHDMSTEQHEASAMGCRVNSLDWFEEKGIVKLVMRIVEELYAAKIALKKS